MLIFFEFSWAADVDFVGGRCTHLPLLLNWLVKSRSSPLGGCDKRGGNRNSRRAGACLPPVEVAMPPAGVKPAATRSWKQPLYQRCALLIHLTNLCHTIIKPIAFRLSSCHICHRMVFIVYFNWKRMPSGGGPGLQSRAGGITCPR